MATSATEPAHPAPADVLDSPSAGPKAIRGGGVRLVGYVVGSLLTLASAPLLVRHLGLVGFGQYMTIVSLVALVAGVTDAGLTGVALREYAIRRDTDRDAFMRSVLGLRIVLTTAGVGLATAFSLMAGYGSALTIGTLLAGIGLVVGVATSTLSIPLSADLRLGWLTLADIAGKALTVVLVIILVLASAGVVAFLAAAIPAGLLVFGLTVALVRGQVPLRPSLRLRALAGVMRDTLPLAVATVLASLYARVVIIILSLTAAGLTTGYFGTASRVVEVAVGIPTALVATTFPILARAARDDHERLRYVLQRLFEVALIGGTWMALVTALAADPVILLLGGREAAPAVPVLQIMALALIAVSLNASWQNGLLALHRHREILLANAVGLIAIVGLCLVLVPPLGAEGAALAVVLADSALVGLSGVFLARAHPRLRPAPRVVPRVLAAVAAALGLAALLPADQDVARAALATLAYFAVLTALGAIPHEFRHAVVTRLRPGT